MIYRHEPVLLAGLAVCTYAVVKFGPQTVRLLMSSRWRDGLQYAVSVGISALGALFFGTGFGLFPVTGLYVWVNRGPESVWFLSSVIALAALSSLNQAKLARSSGGRRLRPSLKYR